jgi:signal transduction histidine kinase
MRDNTTDDVIGFMDVLRDITKRKEMEAQIQAAQSKLIQTARHSAIGELASGVAHQISNPLTTIIADAQIMLKDLSAQHPARESAEAIEEAGWQAQAAVKRLIDFSRPPTISHEFIRINQTIENAISLVGGHIESIGVTLTLELADDLPTFKGNAAQIEDLWVNLLLLARDATDDGQTHEIYVRSEKSDEKYLEVSIQDDGKRIPTDALDNVFEPDFTGSKIGRGMGMELSICREIVRQHGGQIAVKSDTSAGTAFTVTLPIEEVRR